MRCESRYPPRVSRGFVSIHTPTWGVSAFWCSSGFTTMSFNPHTYMRCESTRGHITPPAYMTFQSTHLHEVWDITERACATIKPSFNPHTYMRCETCFSDGGQYFIVSIHTPTWGVSYGDTGLERTSMFQSTHLHEVWGEHSLLYTPRQHRFNPHTYMRCETCNMII